MRIASLLMGKKGVAQCELEGHWASSLSYSNTMTVRSQGTLELSLSYVFSPPWSSEEFCSQDDPGSFLNQVISLLAAKVAGAWVSGLGNAHWLLL